MLNPVLSPPPVRLAGAVMALAAGLLLSACQTMPGWMLVQGKAQVTDHLHFANLPMARPATPWVLPTEAGVTLQWPGKPSTAAAEAWLQTKDTTALIVLRRGKVVYERYFGGFKRDTVGTSFSMSKSVVSLLVGVAIAEGRIASVEDPVTRYLPELLRNDPRFAQVRLRHLLQMRSGVAFDEGYFSPFSDAAYYYLTSDLPAQIRLLQIARPPGQDYSYQSGDTQLLGMALERAVGQPMPRYAQTKLWQPMGAEFDASWSLDSAASGVTKAFCCLNARAIDFARLGQLVLQNGQRADHRGNRRIIPAAWLHASTAAQLDNEAPPGASDAARRNIEDPGLPGASFYAWQWRRAPQPRPDPGPVPSEAMQPGSDFYASGLLGQYIYIAPETQTVIVRLGWRNDEPFWAEWLGTLARMNP